MGAASIPLKGRATMRILESWMSPPQYSTDLEKRLAQIVRSMLVALLLLMVSGLPLSLYNPGVSLLVFVSVVANVLALAGVIAGLVIFRRGSLSGAVLL